MKPPELFDTYADQLYDYCRLTLTDGDAAAAATHDALISAVAHADRLQVDRRRRAWLFAFALSECRRRASPEDGQRWGRAPGTVIPAEREVLLLRHRYEFDLSDVAAILGVGRAGVTAKQARAEAHAGQSGVARLRYLQQVPAPISLRAQTMATAGDPEQVAEIAGRWDGFAANGMPFPVPHAEHAPARKHLRRAPYAPMTVLAGAATLAGALLLAGGPESDDPRATARAATGSAAVIVSHSPSPRTNSTRIPSPEVPSPAPRESSHRPRRDRPAPAKPSSPSPTRPSPSPTVSPSVTPSATGSPSPDASLSP